MPADRFVEQLNIQIGHEFAAHQQYVACAVYYDALDHAADGRVLLRPGDGGAGPRHDDGEVPDRPGRPGADSRRRRARRSDFADLVAPVELALDQERRVTAQINELTKIAREEYDFASDQFMQWFIKEQVEEVATMSDLVDRGPPLPGQHRGHRGLHSARAERRGRRPDRPGHRGRLARPCPGSRRRGVTASPVSGASPWLQPLRSVSHPCILGSRAERWRSRLAGVALRCGRLTRCRMTGNGSGPARAGVIGCCATRSRVCRAPPASPGRRAPG